MQAGTEPWQETTIGELVEFFDHKRVPLNSRERQHRKGPYPYYGASGIIDYVDDYIFDGRYLLIAEDGENLNSRKTPIAFFAEGKFWVNNHAHIIKAKPGWADDYFIKAWFDQADISGYVTGAAQPKLSQTNLKQITIRIPSLAVQLKISKILSTYDDLIENNLRRIKILEEMAQALYREWFVHFRFPGHEKVRLVDSPLGKIPEGWELVKTTDAIFVNPRTPVSKDGMKHYVAMNGLATDSMLISNIVRRSGNLGSKYKNGDTLFARITPCLEHGKTGFVMFLPTDETVGIGSTEFIVLRSKTLCSEYVYFLARSEAFRGNAIKSMTGASGRQRVQNSCFESFYLPHPDNKILQRFAKIAQPYFHLISLLAEKNRNLRRTRDLLLPKLISGELDVSELDIAVPEDDPSLRSG